MVVKSPKERKTLDTSIHTGYTNVLTSVREVTFSFTLRELRYLIDQLSTYHRLRPGTRLMN